MGVNVRPSRLGRAIKAEVTKRLQEAAPALAQILVAQAKRRISSGGDSTHRYPDLWPNPKSYRAGGQPLRNTGQLMNGLTGQAMNVGEGIRLRLKSAHIHAQYHQHGYKTKGPNFIPLTRKAARKHVKGRNPKDEGLKAGTDYIMAWGGVTVPQRKIFNMPPEDMAELQEAAKQAVLGA